MKAILYATVTAASLACALGADVPTEGHISTVRTQDSAVAPSDPSGYSLVIASTAVFRDTILFTLPGGQKSSGVNSTFPTMEALRAVYPEGPYTSQLTHFETPTKSTTYSLSADIPVPGSFDGVPVPQILNTSWSGGSLVVDPNFTLSLAPWISRPASSLIRLQLAAPGVSFISQNFDHDVTQYTFPTSGNFALEPNTRYSATLAFADLITPKRIAISGASPGEFRFDTGYGQSITFTLETVPEPSSSVLLAAAGGFCFLCHLARRTHGSAGILAGAPRGAERGMHIGSFTVHVSLSKRHSDLTQIPLSPANREFYREKLKPVVVDYQEY